MNNQEHGKEYQRLLDDFQAWLGDTSSAWDAQPALDYKLATDDSRLTFWTHEMVDHLIQGYLPAKAVLLEDEAYEVAETICKFFRFLEATGLSPDDSEPADDLVAHLESHIPDFVADMADPHAGGPAKQVLMAMLEDGVDLDDEGAVGEWIDQFNADDLIAEPSTELPPTTRVDPADAFDSVLHAPLFAKLTGFAEYMGEGRPLTQKGNLKLADARRLVESLETGDVVDPVHGDRVFKTHTAKNLLWLDMIVRIAREVRAVKVRNNKMSATKKWLQRAGDDPLDVMRDVAGHVLDTGPVSTVQGDRGYETGLRTAVDASAVSLLASLSLGNLDFELGLANLADQVPEYLFIPEWYHGERSDGETFLESSLRFHAQRAATLLEMTGLLTWTGGELVQDSYGFRDEWRGGTLSITPFGMWIVQGHLVDAGMLKMAVVEPLTVTLDDTPEEIVVALAGYADTGPDVLVGAWEELGGWDGLPDQLWRVDHVQTEALLETLGDTLPERKSAKAARKALFKHRSWMAGTH